MEQLSASITAATRAAPGLALAGPRRLRTEHDPRGRLRSVVPSDEAARRARHLGARRHDGRRRVLYGPRQTGQAQTGQGPAADSPLRLVLE